MRHALLLGACLMFAVLVPCAWSAQVVHVNFDTAPDGSAIANGTVVDMLYWTDDGVQFSAIRCPACGADPNVYASSNCLNFGPLSPPNVVTLFGITTCSDISETNLGLVNAVFASPVDTVCIGVIPVRLTDYGVLHAYDGTNTEIATVYSSPGVTGYLCANVTGIMRVSFSGAGIAYAWFDNLSFQVENATPTRHPSWGQLKSSYR